MGLYERLLEEAGRECANERNDPSKEPRRRVSAYVGRRKSAFNSESNLTSAKAHSEREQYGSELRSLAWFESNGAYSLASGYAFLHLKKKHPREYLRMRSIRYGYE